MTAQELKTSILQLAVQGELVQQNPDDESVLELLKRIDLEKEESFKNGLIKKDKKLRGITTDDCPYEIPNSWEWMRLGHLCQLLDGEILSGKRLPYLEAKYLRGKIEATILDKGKFVKKDTRLILVDGENSGEVFLATEDGYMGSTFKVLYIPCSIYAPYVLYFLLLKKELFRNKKTGAAIPHLNKELFFNLPIPIPPYSEQERIVAKIEELLPYVEEYDKSEKRLAELNNEFPDKLRKSVLQQAVQGKLTERHPDDEPASELLKRIREEKLKLISEGKIKKEKTLPPITDDEKTFEIPNTWEWARLDDVYSVGTGMTPLKSNRSFYENGTIPWITSSLTSNRYIDHAESYITEYALESNSLELYPENTLLIAMYGQGKTRGQISELLISATINQACAALVAFSKRDTLNQYIYFYFQYYYESLRKKAEGSSQPNLNLTKIRECVIPVPPLAEQKRIVARIEEIFAVCDKLE